jgi:hypothetical protein
MVRASGRLQSSLAALRDAFGLAASPTFTAFFNQMTEIFISIRPAVAAFGQALGTTLKPFLDGLVIVFNAIIEAGSALLGLFNLLAGLINKTFGTNVSGIQLFTTVVVAMIAAFAPFVPLVLLAATLTKRFIDFLVSVDWVGLVKPAVDFWNTIVNAVNNAAIAVSNAWNTSINFVKDLWNSLTSTISGWATSAINFVNSVIDRVKALGSALASIAGSDAGQAAAAPQFASGGDVRGAGTSRSDSIWARLSNGEFVVQAAAVRKYGSQFLHAINSMSFSPRNFPGFSVGGLVDALAPARAIPAYASGGAVKTGGPNSIVNLTIGQESFFGLRAPEDTASKLTKYAQRKGLRSSGRKPGWYGG